MNTIKGRGHNKRGGILWWEIILKSGVNTKEVRVVVAFA